MTEEKFMDPSADFQVYTNDEKLLMPPAQDPYPEIVPDWRVFPNAEIPDIDINAIEEATSKKYDITLLFKQMRNST